MWRMVFITLHAAAGVIAFAAGCLALRWRGYLTVYFWSLVAMVGLLAVAVAVDWPGLSTATRVLFAALLGLAGYMIWRAVQARRLQPAAGPGQQARAFDHIGFTLIALFEGFVVILTLDLGAPVWLVVAVAVAGVAVGRATLTQIKGRMALVRELDATDVSGER